MKLDEFIKETLLQIANGVNEAIECSKEHSFNINPAKDMKPEIQTIKFSVMVETSTKGGMNIKIAEAGASTSNVNRIEFDVKMTLPCTEDIRYKCEKPIRKPPV